MVKKGQCADVIFPFQGINDETFLSLWCDYAIRNKKILCFGCKKRAKIGTPLAHCSECHYYFHLKCEQINNNKDSPLPPEWICSCCVIKSLPFANINDENMKLTNQGFSDENIDFVMDKCPHLA